MKKSYLTQIGGFSFRKFCAIATLLAITTLTLLAQPIDNPTISVYQSEWSKTEIMQEYCIPNTSCGDPQSLHPVRTDYRGTFTDDNAGNQVTKTHTEWHSGPLLHTLFVSDQTFSTANTNLNWSTNTYMDTVTGAITNDIGPVSYLNAPHANEIGPISFTRNYVDYNAHQDSLALSKHLLKSTGGTLDVRFDYYFYVKSTKIGFDSQGELSSLTYDSAASIKLGGVTAVGPSTSPSYPASSGWCQYYFTIYGNVPFNKDVTPRVSDAAYHTYEIAGPVLVQIRDKRR